MTTTASHFESTASFFDESVQRRTNYRVSYLARRYQLGPEDRQDLRQELWLALLRASRRFDPALCPAERFIGMVLNRHCKHHVRQQSVARTRPQQTPWDAKIEAVLLDPQAEADLHRTDLRHDSREDLEKILEQCPGSQAQLMLALARLAGLRHDSETRRLEWGFVDWDRCRLRVLAPKTERHEGHRERYVPLCPRLMQLLLEHYHRSPTGQRRILTVKGRTTINRHVEAAMSRAGITPWQRLWQTLRTSCEQDWAMVYPQYAVSKWMGHSIAVSGRHYTPVPDVLFDQAAGRDLISALQNPTTGSSAKAGNSGNDEKRENPQLHDNASDCTPLREFALSADGTETWRRGDSNP